MEGLEPDDSRRMKRDLSEGEQLTWKREVIDALSDAGERAV